MKTALCLGLPIVLMFLLVRNSAVGEGPDPSVPAQDAAVAPAESKGMSPTSAEVEAQVRRLKESHPKLVDVRVVFKTYQGRPIQAVTVTDPGVANDDKQNVLIIAGRHGNEETGRMVARALLDWLASDEAAATRAKQKIVVIPNINPDGAEQDAYQPPKATGPVEDTGEDGRPPESAAWARIAREDQPELFIDIHARGHAGCSYDMVLYPGTRDYTEDENLVRAFAADMVRAGEEAGIPHITHPLGWWTPDNPASRAPCIFAYRRYKSISLLTENCESNSFAYPPELRVRSGLAKVRAAIDHGNRRHPKFYYEGYPNGLMGLYDHGFVPVGKTAAQRRAGRVKIWQRYGDIRIERKIPEQLKFKKVTVKNKGEAIDGGVGAMIRAGGKMAVESVTLDGRKLEASETAGYYTWQDVCSTFVVIAMPSLPAGDRDIEIRFE